MTSYNPLTAAMMSNAGTGYTPSPLVIDIAELLSSHEAVQSQESADRSTLSILLNESRETLRPQMFTWAGAHHRFFMSAAL